MRGMSRNIRFSVGIAVIALVVLPPLGTIAQQLFAAHMAQHLLLIVVAAPLLVVSGPDAPLQRFAIYRAWAQPAAAWVGFVAIFIFWHWAAAFQWAARSTTGEVLELGTILAAAFAFWDVALSRTARVQLSDGARALYVMTAAVATDLPGVIMVFSPRAICTMPGENATHWGLTPLQDQQIAGLLMWVIANLVFFSIATWLFARWISDSQPSQPHLDSVIP
jgi:putative membrane protein